MTDIKLEAPPRSRDNIAALSGMVRTKFSLAEPYLPVAELLEIYMQASLGDKFTFTVGEPHEMGGRHGFVDPATGELCLRSDVYDGLIGGRGRDRFTACHELGHWLMHRGNALNRVRDASRVPAFRCPEWQANEFAGAILMPAREFKTMTSISQAMEVFGVSRDAARVQAQKLGLEKQLRGS